MEVLPWFQRVTQEVNLQYQYLINIYMETKYAFLVIDDNLIDQFITTQLFKKMLDISEINVTNNGKEGIKWLCENRKKISEPLIILLDIQMPIMNGYQFLTE